MACYITGKFGFIGKRLTDYLNKEGIRVQDNFGGADTVIHLASYGNHSWQTDIGLTFMTNVVETYNLLERCRLSGHVKNFIFIGSSSEYGEKVTPMQETDLPETKTMYGCTKVCGTYLTRYYSKYFNTVTIRPFSIFGEEEDERRFIPRIIKCLLTGETLKLSDGNHDWLHVDGF